MFKHCHYLSHRARKLCIKDSSTAMRNGISRLPGSGEHRASLLKHNGSLNFTGLVHLFAT